ncbi:MAG TPA: sodium:proton exchanger [Elusimicrobia bacterium]|jgi:NhaP-type Na+/H+ or K+/H+ antiporter|nr:sodium:proton exchanger [Elusimicrobiota bacterium]
MGIAIVIVAVGLLVFLAHLFSALFERTRVPDVLPLVLLGFLVGPIFGLVPPEAFGKVGNVFTSIALVVILFQSGLGLNFLTLRESMMPGIKITVVNFMGTTIVVSLFSIFLLGMSVLEGLTLGSILGGTSSAVVIPMVSKLRLQQGSRTMLLLESTFSDVLCIVVTIAFIQAIKYHELIPSLIFGQIVASFLLATVIGAFAAFFWSNVLSRVRRLENSTFTTPAFVFIVFGVTELLGYSGAISVFAFGIVLGNIQKVPLTIFRKFASLQPITLNETEKAFFSEIVFLLKTFFFVYIGLSIRINQLIPIIIGLLYTLVVFAIRIPVVRLSMDKALGRLDASLASVIVPKGLAAAVLASLPLQAGIEKGVIMQDVTYAVILFSIIATTILTFLIEKNILQKPYSSVFSKYASDSVENNNETTTISL